MSINSIEFKKVSKKYTDNYIIKDLDLNIKKGERLILLGPSGCGKTTTLRMIAGLEDISDGELLMDGVVVNDIAAGERNIAMVFQSYALFPHMSVWENIVFGLNIQKLPKAEIEKRAKEALEILNLKGYEHRKPKELSGGQKQRVALCRALVKQSPYFLLDEPLSNLDAQLRQQARTELVKIHEIYKPTMIYVTHDQIEAMTVADRIAILDKGNLQQLDTPDNIYRRPANIFVATFIGTPPMNILPAVYHGQDLLIADSWLSVPEKWQKIVTKHKDLKLGIRPEHCYLSDRPQIAAKISYVENLGNQRIVKMQLGSGLEVNVAVTDVDYDLTQASGISIDWEKVSLFDSVSGINLGYPDND